MEPEELLRAESSQRQHYQDLEHQAKMNILVEQEEYNLFTLLRPTLKKDGNQWCCLYGDNLQEGIVGFGDTPYLAIIEWTKAMRDGLIK
jgi:hypothetical protein